MKARTIFVTIDCDNIPGKSDYPKNVPLPRIGETVIFESFERERKMGRVYDIRHVITGNVVDITIKVREE